MVLHYGKSCVFGLLAFFAFSPTAAVVVVQDDGYQNILVTFSPDIEKGDQSEVLSATKDLITLASNVVYKATGIPFGEVVLLLPYTWGDLESLSDVENIAYSSTNEVYYDANIFVEKSGDTVYGTQPYTLQRGGCGLEGVRMTIPKDFLTSAKSTEDERAKLIAREWIRFRYGVFYENGYPNDELYPLYLRHPGSNDPEDIHITGCTDKPLNYTFENPTGEECPLSVDESGRPDQNSAECQLRPQKNENNSDVVLSSLMYLQDLPSVVHLCDDTDHVHNADVPNKQNSLCNGRSIWNVMSEHPDFEKRAKSGGTSSPTKPKFKIVVDRNPRIVLAIDRSSSTPEEIQNVVTKATRKLIYDLPEETEFALFFFDSNVLKPYSIPFGLLQRRLPESTAFLGKEKPCLSCAINEGLQVLKDNSRTEGTIVLMSSTDSVDVSEDLLDKLKSSQICLVVILYGSDLSRTGFQKLLNASPCSHFWIMPSVDSAPDALIKLNEQFECLIKNHSYHNANYTIETVPMSEVKQVSFQTDRSVKDFGIRLTSMIVSFLEEVLDDSNVVLKNSKGNIIEFERKEKFADFWTYQVSSAMGERWSFEIKDIAPKGLPVLLQVVAKESNSESLRVRSWIGDTTPQEESTSSEQLPVILYVEVTMGINPVLDAEVRANIVTPEGTPLKVELLDNGLGDPDVTKYDGIYSRYFTQFTSGGEYQVTININDNGSRSKKARPPQSGPSIPCCGSFVPTGGNEDTGPFARVIHMNFRARSGRSDSGYKPSRVQDLRLLSWEYSTNLITFQWTSPGDEMDSGTAQKYTFNLFETKAAAQNFKDEITDAFRIKDLVTPQSYANKETVRIQLNESLTDDKNYFFAMRSESTRGRQSDTSNVVEIVIPVTITSPPPTDDAIITGDDDKDSGKSKTASTNGKIIGIIVGVCVLVIIICICAYVAFYLLMKRKRKSDKDESSDKHPQKESTEPNEDNGDGTEPDNEWQMKNNSISISPVNSWPSNILVNHHEKVKEAKRKKEKPPVFTLENLENSSGEINTISNGLLPNPIYSSHAEILNENQDNETYATPQLLQDHGVRPSRRVTHV